MVHLLHSEGALNSLLKKKKREKKKRISVIPDKKKRKKLKGEKYIPCPKTVSLEGRLHSSSILIAPPCPWGVEEFFQYRGNVATYALVIVSDGCVISHGLTFEHWGWEPCSGLWHLNIVPF